MIVPNADLKFARDTLRSFVDAVALCRAVSEFDGNGRYFLTVARGNSFDIAVISWCILFGSDHTENQRLHWKNMFDPDPFRKDMLEAVGCSFEEWKEYRTLVVDYRNELAAHRDLNPDTRFNPNFDLALLAANFYHQRLGDRFEKEVGKKFDNVTLLEEFERRREAFAGDLQAHF